MTNGPSPKMPDSQETKKIATPKAFVSYAQSEERTPWISDVCERLIHDGVDVVVDLYELPHSADIHAFTVRCVNDPSITRVLMFCDVLYCEKANDRRGGVGKETQIISEEVYNNIGQTKFLSIFCGVYDDGKPCLPIYLKSLLEVSVGDRLFDAREGPRKLGNLTPGFVRATAPSKARPWQAPSLHHNSTITLSASRE